MQRRFVGRSRTGSPRRREKSRGPGLGNEFVIFSKPELGRLNSSDLATVWDLFAGSFAAYDVDGAPGQDHDRARARPGRSDAAALWGDQPDLPARPARTDRGRRGITAAGCSATTPRDTVVLGGHQFLERYADVSPFALGDAVRQRGGSAGSAPERTPPRSGGIDGATVVILNGFHPRQLSFFTADDGGVRVPARQQSGTDWEVAALGTDRRHRPEQGHAPVHPRHPVRGARRRSVWPRVNSNFNGVHMSAGPLEGLGELDRFFGEVQSLAGWSFAGGVRWRPRVPRRGRGERGFLANPGVIESGGERGTAFDLTEGVDSESAAVLLAKARARSASQAAAVRASDLPRPGGSAGVLRPRAAASRSGRPSTRLALGVRTARQAAAASGRRAACPGRRRSPTGRGTSRRRRTSARCQESEQRRRPAGSPSRRR